MPNLISSFFKAGAAMIVDQCQMYADQVKLAAVKMVIRVICVHRIRKSTLGKG
jgi:dihydropteroate synthase